MQFTGERFIPNAIDNVEIETEHYQRYLSVQNLAENKVVLDIASGEGYGSFLLSEKAKQVFGVDVSLEAVEYAKQKYAKENLEFLEGSVAKIPLPDKSVDMVVSFETIEHVNEELQKLFLGEIKRVLKENGVLVISTPDKHNYSDLYNYKNEFHIKEFYKDEFKEFLNQKFSYISLFSQRMEAAYVLSNESGGDLTTMLSENAKIETKYIVALCSDDAGIMDKNIGSVVFDLENRFRKMINRILQLQDEVEIIHQRALSAEKKLKEADNKG